MARPRKLFKKKGGHYSRVQPAGRIRLWSSTTKWSSRNMPLRTDVIKFEDRKTCHVSTIEHPTRPYLYEVSVELRHPNGKLISRIEETVDSKEAAADLHAKHKQERFEITKKKKVKKTKKKAKK